MENKHGYRVSLQITQIHDITTDMEFKEPVLLKNITDDAISAEVKLPEYDEWVSTTFYPGWNPEQIMAIRNVTSNELQYGL